VTLFTAGLAGDPYKCFSNAGFENIILKQDKNLDSRMVN
jgi:hypothetical protein